MPSEKAKEYLEMAITCRAAAAQSVAADKARWLGLAEQWQRLADRLEGIEAETDTEPASEPDVAD